jgi:hypothetical protein
VSAVDCITMPLPWKAAPNSNSRLVHPVSVRGRLQPTSVGDVAEQGAEDQEVIHFPACGARRAGQSSVSCRRSPFPNS